MAKQKRKRYTDEFKAEPVKLIVEESYSISQTARSLDINTNMLTRWKSELTGNVSQRKQAADDKEEIRQLREEIRHLKLEKEILKKATVYSTGQRNRYYLSPICCRLKYEANDGGSGARCADDGGLAAPTKTWLDSPYRSREPIRECDLS